MGNQLAPASRGGVEQFADLPNLVLKDVLGRCIAAKSLSDTRQHN
jgi:hypothetical protein